VSRIRSRRRAGAPCSSSFDRAGSPGDFELGDRDYLLQLWVAAGCALPTWGLLGAPATTVVQDNDATPYVVHSSDPILSRVLAEEWSHEEVLARLP
jgi:hypothetical protein